MSANQLLQSITPPGIEVNIFAAFPLQTDTGLHQAFSFCAILKAGLL